MPAPAIALAAFAPAQRTCGVRAVVRNLLFMSVPEFSFARAALPAVALAAALALLLIVIGVERAQASLMNGLVAHALDRHEEAAGWLRPHARPLEQGGIPAARHAMAQIALSLAGGDPVKEPQAQQEAERWLDPVTRCHHPDFLATYAYVVHHSSDDEASVDRAIMLYKEAAEAGSLRAMYNLGRILALERNHAVLGASYAYDAAIHGYTRAKTMLIFVQSLESGIVGIQRAKDVAENQDIVDRQPRLDPNDHACVSF